VGVIPRLNGLEATLIRDVSSASFGFGPQQARARKFLTGAKGSTEIGFDDKVRCQKSDGCFRESSRRMNGHKALPANVPSWSYSVGSAHLVH